MHTLGRWSKKQARCPKTVEDFLLGVGRSQRTCIEEGQRNGRRVLTCQFGERSGAMSLAMEPTKRQWRHRWGKQTSLHFKFARGMQVALVIHSARRAGLSHRAVLERGQADRGSRCGTRPWGRRCGDLEAINQPEQHNQSVKVPYMRRS
eukprot:3919934-Amphidinium_carterae.1